MIRTFYERVALVDTSAVIALHDPEEPYHSVVRSCFSKAQGLVWAAADLTSHECFTTVRYAQGFDRAIEHFHFFRNGSIRLLRFLEQDERAALDLLSRYSDHRLSFHDAACAALMQRVGIFRILTLDSDFLLFGFELLPGAARTI